MSPGIIGTMHAATVEGEARKQMPLGRQRGERTMDDPRPSVGVERVSAEKPQWPVSCVGTES